MSQQFEPVRTAVVGAGYWGRNLVRNFAGLPQADLVRVIDASEDVQERTRSQYPGTEVTADFEDALKDDVEAVVLAVPAEAHAPLAKRVLEAGKHVFVEKPLTLSPADGLELLKLSESTGKVCMVGHLLEYHPCVEMMKRLIAEGEIGELRYIYSQRVNLGIVRQAENALWSLAPHDLSIILTLMGAMPKTVCAWGNAYLQPGIEDVAFLVMNFADGRMSHSHVSWLDPHKIRKFTVVGSKKMIVFDDAVGSEKIRVYDKRVDVTPDYESFQEYLAIRSGDIHIPAVPGGEPLRTECLHFVEAVRGLHPARSDAASGLRVVEILNAGNTSLKEGGRPVEVEDLGKAGA